MDVVKSERALMITRELDAPRELVFDAWTQPQHAGQWWGPLGFTTTTHEMSATPGGTWRFTMHGPDGTDYPNKIVFTEVRRPERLTYHHSGDSENDPTHFDVVVTFEELGDRTKLTMRMTFAIDGELQRLADEVNAIEGARQHIERLGEYVAGMKAAMSDVQITRTFDAPRELVFRAWTDPDRLAQWYAPHGCTIAFRQLDVREGGAFHSVIRTPDGSHCWCRGIYTEVVAPERIVYTMAVADADGNLITPAEAGMDPEWPAETTVTVTFAEHDGKTTLTLHQTVSETVARRTGAHPSWLQMLDRLDEQLSSASSLA